MTVTESSADVASTTPPPRWKLWKLTPSQRRARGRSARDWAPRAQQGEWRAGPDRPDPIALLESQAETRVPELLPIRYGRMSVSPGTFYRGAALIMAADLAGTPTSGVTVQLCGDAHLMNFGVFASPERQLVFDINDFDETLPGPWEWDVKRLVASLEIAGRDRGFRRDQREEVVLACAQEYRERIRESSSMRTLDAWYAHLDVEEVDRWMEQEVREKRLGKREHKEVGRDIAKARTRDHVRVFARRVGEVGGHLRIVGDPPLITPIEDLVGTPEEHAAVEQSIRKLLKSYRKTLSQDHHPIEEFRFVHLARKVVGVGSVGTRCWILLLTGRDKNDPLFLQAKEAQASVLERYVGASAYRHHGRRVVAGQHLMQAATDIFLGWQRAVGLDGTARDYYIRQFQDWKGSVEIDTLSPSGALLYGRVCATALARAHARWGDRIAVASYLGKGDVFDRAMVEFARRYADQNERDYEALLGAIRSGRLPVEYGV
ncbi:MAG TPA: DUF2252 domain-containing protein [Actinomycetes bacterium]|nr:DUF2252 domain-containing protein [Actinomycetes bacterium]